jgi:hypothetical protein
MTKILVTLVAVALLALPVFAANRVVVENLVDTGTELSFNVSNDIPIAGLAAAFKFAEKGDDVTISAASFAGTRLEYLAMKEAIIDNVEKTVVVYGIVLQEENLAPGEGSIVKLSFTGNDLDRVKFTPTLVGKQEGVTLVDASAKEIKTETADESKLSAGKGNLPGKFDVFQNFPNPFNATTQIRYNLPKDAQVKLEVFNILGQKVRTLVDEPQTAGFKQIIWDGTNSKGDIVSSGVYFYRIKAGDLDQVLKMSLLK